QPRDIRQKIMLGTSPRQKRKAMRRIGLKRAAAGAGPLAVAVAVAVATVAAQPIAASAAPARSHCIVFDQLTEKVLQAGFNDLPPAGYSPGDVGTWHNQLISASGAVIADVNGSSLIVAVSASQLPTSLQNTDTFVNGEVRSAGMMDAYAVLAGKWISIPAFGVSGRYQGKVGTRSFRMTSVPNVYEANLTLC